MEEKRNDQKWHETLTVKLVLLGFMTLSLLIPLQLITVMIRDRESYSSDATAEISEHWGGPQTIAGPVLNVPVERVKTLSDGKSIVEREVWHILPETLEIIGTADPEIRYKGIYEAVIYSSSMKVQGSFSLPKNRLDGYKPLWKEAYISVGISDNRGIRDSLSLQIDNKNSIEAIPGLPEQQLFSSGIIFPAGSLNPGEKFSFSMDIGLRGSGGLYFMPTGKVTSISISSAWSSPSFTGTFLPVERNIEDSGFSATWETTYLNRNFPLEWTGYNEGFGSESFGVDMVLDVDHYLKSERSTKYGIIFIALTFFVLLFLELSSSRKIHIFSYFLVGLALVLFFSLLTSLSEQTGFNLAYLISALATITLVTLFSGSIVDGRRTFLTVSGTLSTLYAFIFVLLSLKEYSWLAGNIGLFIVLAVIMRLAVKTKLINNSFI